MKPDQTVALVTGATSGIGRAVARRLLGRGMKVAATGRRQERLEELAAEAAALPGELLPLVADQLVPADNRQIFERLKERWGRLDVLVNNAGMSGGKGLAGAPIEDIQRCFDLNVSAAILCMQLAVDMMRDKGGIIINIGSMAGHRHIPGKAGSVAYAASKHALRAASEGLRMELTRQQIPVKVALISPGMVDTEWHGEAHRGGGQGYAYRPLDAEDLADAVLYVLSTPPHVQVCDLQLRSTSQEA